MTPAPKKHVGGRGKRNEERREIERKLDVTARQAHNILKEGRDIDDIKAAKLRKLTLECDKLEHALAVLRGEYILAAEADEEFRAIGIRIKSVALSWVGSMPGRLEGLTAAQMVPIFQDEIDKLLTEFAR